MAVRAFRFEGNTVFSSEELARVTASYRNRKLTIEDLEEARRALTLYYVSHGYVNSGAVLPDQQVRDGVITFRIVEGTLSEVTVHGNRWLRDDYLTDRLRTSAGSPLDLNKLKDGLLILRQNPNVQQINAELKPGAAPGDSRLDVLVKDPTPFRLGLQIDNDRPPSVGSEEIRMLAGDGNLTGHSDPLDVTYGIARSGRNGWELTELNDVSGSYAFPFTCYDTSLRVDGSRSDSSVIEEPFSTLNIDSEIVRYGATLRQPWHLTPNREFALSITVDREENATSLLGQPYDVSPGSTNGAMRATVLRLGQEWLDRSQAHVLALRSTFNLGLDAFSTIDKETGMNAKFFSWLGQFQYVQRLFNTQNQLILRTDGQWTSNPLLALEQFSVGGADTVRGYRENTLVRDRAVVSSAEFRLPVFYDRRGNGIIQLAPFFDFGGAWNASQPTPDPRTIYSAGIGIIINPDRHLYAQMYWGHPFRSVATPGGDPQDDGFCFRVTVEAF